MELTLPLVLENSTLLITISLLCTTTLFVACFTSTSITAVPGALKVVKEGAMEMEYLEGTTFVGSRTRSVAIVESWGGEKGR